jgi:16S rRNA (cytosine1402-N4)-methyltransferase
LKEEPLHLPVLLQEVEDFLKPAEGKLIVDCTLGYGGHAECLLEKGAKVIGIDKDFDILKITEKKLARYGSKLGIVHGDFRHIDQFLTKLGITEVDGFLYDLGVSSYQLEKADRGFSFQLDGPLDMRMDQGSTLTASHLINDLSEERLAEIIKRYGEDRWAKRIAKKIVTYREKIGPIEKTTQFAQIVKSAYPKQYRRWRIHPATRTFQAIRIAVNDELNALEESLDKAIEYLKPDGIICVISFHSLEDRIVKQKFRGWAKEKSPKIRILTKTPIRATQQERTMNPRARSAKLRAAQRL